MSLARFGARPRVDLGTIRAAAPLRADATPGQRWRFRRNLVIHVAHRAGLSQKLIADVFDLPPSRINAIVKTFAEYENRS